MASVFKSRSVVPGLNTAQAEVFNWEDVATRAKTYLDSVREQAQQMLRETQTECDRIRTLAQQEGMDRGKQQVERMAQQMASQVAAEQLSLTQQSVQHFCDELEQATEQWLKQWQHETIAMAVAIAEKLIERQVEADPTILLDWIQDSVRLVSGQRSIQIRLHPKDAERLSDTLSELIQSSGPNTEISLTEDVAVGQFGVVLQTEDTTIDRTLKTQLRRLSEELQ
jgi:flagellar biosynthesis/type III secretory pathway protein FliH